MTVIELGKCKAVKIISSDEEGENALITEEQQQDNAKNTKLVALSIFVVYAVCAISFFSSYFTTFPKDIRWYFNADFVEMMEEADALPEYDSLYITGHMNWLYNVQMAEILTQYSCKIDAHYYQGLTNIAGERSLLPYSQRYHFVYMSYHNFADREALHILHRSELGYLPENYEIVLENDSYVAVKW